MQIAVDMTRCQSYAQCCFLAPDTFRFVGEEALVYTPHPSDADRFRVLQAAAACPVQAIRVDRRDLPLSERTTRATSSRRVSELDSTHRVVVVGASLAGLRAAEAVRRAGFEGSLTLVGDEPTAPYDRPPLSKQVLIGMTDASETALPSFGDLRADWRLGIAATHLDTAARQISLADGDQLTYDRLLIATGARARPWPTQREAVLDGVVTLRTADDAAELRHRLANDPRRVLVIGGGFTGSEVASSCRELDLEVTLVDRGPAPLSSVLGTTLGRIMGEIQRDNGVDLRPQTTVVALEGDAHGRLKRAHLSDGSSVDAEVAVVALGALRNVEWLNGSGLDADAGGIGCDETGRALTDRGLALDDVFVAGDVARYPHPRSGPSSRSLEHWGDAVAQAEIAGSNLASGRSSALRYESVPVFWSVQFGHSIKALGVPSIADEVMISQGSVESRAFVALFGREGRTVGAISIDHPKWLEHHRAAIATGAPFPPAHPIVDRGPRRVPAPAGRR